MQIPFLELPFFPKYYSLYVSVIVTDSPGNVASDGSIVKLNINMLSSFTMTLTVIKVARVHVSWSRWIFIANLSSSVQLNLNIPTCTCIQLKNVHEGIWCHLLVRKIHSMIMENFDYLFKWRLIHDDGENFGRKTNNLSCHFWISSTHCGIVNTYVRW